MNGASMLELLFHQHLFEDAFIWDELPYRVIPLPSLVSSEGPDDLRQSETVVPVAEKVSHRAEVTAVSVGRLLCFGHWRILAVSYGFIPARNKTRRRATPL